MLFSPFPMFGGPVGVGPIPPPPLPVPPPILRAATFPIPTNTVVVIPTDSSTAEIPPYRQTSPLDGVAYVLDFAWNERAQVWTMAVSTAAGQLLADSIPIRNGVPVGVWAHALPSFPQGLFQSVTTDNTTADAGQSDLGSRVLLTYLQSRG